MKVLNLDYKFATFQYFNFVYSQPICNEMEPRICLENIVYSPVAQSRDQTTKVESTQHWNHIAANL